MKFVGLYLLFSSVLCFTGLSQELDLRGSWKFHLGDKAMWSSSQYDDSSWEIIKVPSAWEDEGFNGYDGFAWYRKKFDGTRLNANDYYVLNLGYIDDCDQVFLNGNLIGFSGSMPPHFKTAYNKERKYNIPSNYLNFKGENIIAVRIFDVVHGGGIIDGDVKIKPAAKNSTMLVDLQGIWSFAKSWDGERVTNEKSWGNIMVPGPWEYLGYHDYDGFGWYKRTFSLPSTYQGEQLVLILGKIDDFDKVYLNGQLIGQTNDHRRYGVSTSYERQRAYEIPQELVKKNGLNLIEILVEDMGNVGGIYEGPVGIMRMADHKWRR